MTLDARNKKKLKSTIQVVFSSSSKCPCPAVKSENVIILFIVSGNIVFLPLISLKYNIIVLKMALIDA